MAKEIMDIPIRINLIVSKAKVLIDLYFSIILSLKAIANREYTVCCILI